MNNNVTNLEQPEYVDNVVNFPKNKRAKQPEIDPLEKECSKIKLDGTPKKTKNNSKRNRDNVL